MSTYQRTAMNQLQTTLDTLNNNKQCSLRVEVSDECDEIYNTTGEIINFQGLHMQRSEPYEFDQMSLHRWSLRSAFSKVLLESEGF